MSSEDGNKQQRVLWGLRNLRDGKPKRGHGSGPQPADHDKLREVVEELANELQLDMSSDDRLVLALIEDGFADDGRGVVVNGKSEDSPTSRLADYLNELFDEDDRFAVAQNHYEQAMQAFDRGHWEAANGQFRSAFEATFDALAWMNDCPPNKKAGEARKWLQENGLLDKGEADLIKSFGSFASGAGSHAGLSGKADCQLRRHFVTALMVYGVKKLSADDDSAAEQM